MLSLQEMQAIADSKNVIFYKRGCPFCVATQNLFDALANQQIVSQYVIYTLGQDFDNQTLTQLVASNGWLADGQQSVASKPQIFVDGQYIGGNFEFYKSKWNVAQDMPNLKNPMRF
jgi:glutaredoxin